MSNELKIFMEVCGAVEKPLIMMTNGMENV